MEPFISQIGEIADQELLNNLLPSEWRCDSGNTVQSSACIGHTSNYSLLTTTACGFAPWNHRVPSHSACNSAGGKPKAQANRRGFHSAMSQPNPTQPNPCHLLHKALKLRKVMQPHPQHRSKPFYFSRSLPGSNNASTSVSAKAGVMTRLDERSTASMWCQTECDSHEHGRNGRSHAPFCALAIFKAEQQRGQTRELCTLRELKHTWKILLTLFKRHQHHSVVHRLRFPVVAAQRDRDWVLGVGGEQGCCQGQILRRSQREKNLFSAELLHWAWMWGANTCW